jgi:hypothetical protein
MGVKKHGFHLFEGKQPLDLKTVAYTYSADGKVNHVGTYPFEAFNALRCAE